MCGATSRERSRRHDTPCPVQPPDQGRLWLTTHRTVLCYTIAHDASGVVKVLQCATSATQRWRCSRACQHADSYGNHEELAGWSFRVKFPIPNGAGVHVLCVPSHMYAHRRSCDAPNMRYNGGDVGSSPVQECTNILPLLPIATSYDFVRRLSKRCNLSHGDHCRVRTLTAAATATYMVAGVNWAVAVMLCVGVFPCRCLW